MKKQLLFFSTFFAALNLCAQPTLTGDNTNPVIGETETSFDAPYTAPGNAGANQTWDFSSLVGTISPTSSVVATPSTPKGADFQNSNICVVLENNYGYFKASSSVLQLIGMLSNTVKVSYSDPEDWLRYPFTYNNSFTDNLFGEVSNNGGIQMIRKGSLTVTADGYGTLKTPLVTHSNVLRIHTTMNYRDSASYQGLPIVIKYVEDSYAWFTPGTHSALFSIFSVTIDDDAPEQSSSYTGLKTGVANNDNQLSLSLFPNPVAGDLHISLNVKEAQQIEVQIVNSLGEQVVATAIKQVNAGANSFSVPVADLPEGIYFARLSTAGGTGVETLTYEAKRFAVVR